MGEGNQAREEEEVIAESRRGQSTIVMPSRTLTILAIHEMLQESRRLSGFSISVSKGAALDIEVVSSEAHPTKGAPGQIYWRTGIAVRGYIGHGPKKRLFKAHINMKNADGCWELHSGTIEADHDVKEEFLFRYRGGLGSCFEAILTRSSP